MHFPESFRNKIVNGFEERGAAWLANLPSIVDECSARWKLSNMTVVENLSYHFVCYAESPEYGEVVLKIGLPDKELEAERKALEMYAAKPVCACYDAEPALGAMMLERIIPGFDLTVIRNRDTRYKLAAQLMADLSNVEGDTSAFPQYVAWMEEAFARVQAETVDERLLPLIEQAEVWFRELDGTERPRVVLHGDLHHYNILLDENRGWRAIDPKGVVGIPCMEAARFMENELGMVNEQEKSATLDKMLQIFSETYGESASMIARCLFVDSVLSACWSAEENLDRAKMDGIIHNCQFVLNYIERYPNGSATSGTTSSGVISSGDQSRGADSARGRSAPG